MLRYLAEYILQRCGLKIIKSATYEQFQEDAYRSRALALSKTLEPHLLIEYFSAFEKSTSQLHQDLFVLSQFSFKRNGYFVEFGATDGISLSNTYLLEKHFDWKGILAEPAKVWHESLKHNRTSTIETECIWSESGKTFRFNEVRGVSGHDHALSTLSMFNQSDNHRKTRKRGQEYEVRTLSLIDLLKKYDAPKSIDFLSIDTEGSEYEILSNFDFNQYDIAIICVEHNYTDLRPKINKLLSEHGYELWHPELSLWDDWYVRKSAL